MEFNEYPAGTLGVLRCFTFGRMFAVSLSILQCIRHFSFGKEVYWRETKDVWYDTLQRGAPDQV